MARACRDRRGEEKAQEGWQQELVTRCPASWLRKCGFLLLDCECEGCTPATTLGHEEERMSWKEPGPLRTGCGQGDGEPGTGFVQSRETIRCVPERGQVCAE